LKLDSSAGFVCDHDTNLEVHRNWEQASSQLFSKDIPLDQNIPRGFWILKTTLFGVKSMNFCIDYKQDF
jgi:hypothetical protein